MKNKAPVASNFIRNIIDDDLTSGKHSSIVTRFPPEPNGFAHIGHAKAICLNFGLAEEYHGKCNLRMDDTNPEKESKEYVQSFIDDIHWMGFAWDGDVHFASDYFDRLYYYAVELIQAGKAYVDDLSAEEIRQYRGSLTEPGKNSPYRARSVTDNLDLFSRMKNGEFPDGDKTLRLKIDMSSGNINLRDPVIYRIRRAQHHRTGDKWCIYPMYDYTHCISDAIEGITHSLCTLEFEDHRPLYDWILNNISIDCKPHQYEFSRLELLYTLTSKRKLLALVNEGVVSGWDDPRMPTIVGMRRRGYSPAGMRLFIQRIGVSKSESLIDIALLEDAVRETLEHDSPRLMAVVSPLKVTLTNYEEGITSSRSAPFHPNHPEFGEREVLISRQIWIEQDDYSETPPPEWHRLSLGAEVRLRYSYVIKCEEVIKNRAGRIVELKCRIDHETLGKNPEGRKVKGVIHWVSAEHAIRADVRWYGRLFIEPRPDAVRGDDGEHIDFRKFLNPESLRFVPAYVEASVRDAAPESRFQFERLGYFVTDRHEHKPGEKVVLNRSLGLKENWKKQVLGFGPSSYACDQSG